ncbi:WAT1-related protein At4g08290-like [Glycine soja]|uniref:WAT1-related protein n=1 Tax=Glycine soja TaxID=3848 RepID=A0A0B2PNQ1_GLYSO|nr:WAT1-related protein At4g08290-like [Glycine soja]KHN09197.1 Auxin-induced protein 5NG4 [Glycine soja]RZC06929.1 WAT1-related protein [Glycine soja]
MGTWFTNAKPYLMLLAVQFGSAGMFIFAMDAIKKGMSHYVFIVYRNAIASITLAPFAFVLERKVRPKMTVRIFSEIMALAFFEIILDQCFALLGMKFTSASFLSAVMNSAPSVTFVMAVILKLEHMKMKEVACQAKVIGTIVTFGGTLLMALYKGPIVSVMGSSTSHAGQPENVNSPTGNHWILGTCFLLIGCAGFSAFYILQTITLRKYPTEMSLATWVCFVGALQSSVVAAIAERHHPHTWALGWDTRLFAPAYAGIVTSGVQYYIQGMVIKSMGPVIVTAFNPLRMIIITTLACIVLSEQLYLGSIIGAIVVVLGLYLVVWGKYKECHGRPMPPSLTKDTSPEDQRQLPVTAPKNDTNDNKG